MFRRIYNIINLIYNSFTNDQYKRYKYTPLKNYQNMRVVVTKKYNYNFCNNIRY